MIISPESAIIVSIQVSPSFGLERLEELAQQAGKNRSEMAHDIITFYAMSDLEFCTMMARKTNIEFQYWLSKREMLQQNPELFKTER